MSTRLSFLRQRVAARNPLPEGTISVGVGLIVAGITAYGFLVISGRVLGPEKYASLSALWFLAFFAGPGFFLPLEQEVSRAVAARRAVGMGGAPVIKRAAVAGAALAGALIVTALAGSPALLSKLFDHEVLLFVGFLLVLVGYFMAHLSRGTLSGNGRFHAYGEYVAYEGVVRLVGCIALAVGGIATAGPYGLFIGIAPIVAVGLALRGEHHLLEPGPQAQWSELSAALGYLLVGAALAQLLVNAAPLAAKILAKPSQQKLAGRFVAGVIVARIPVFLFQAIQAALLPKLSSLASAGRHADFRNGLRRLVVALTGLGVVATLAAALLGPWAVRTFFGADFALGRRDLVILAAASAAFMIGLVLAQALIALIGHAQQAVGWVLSVVVFVVVTALGSDLLLRVEMGYLAGSATSVVAMGVFLAQRMAHPKRGVLGRIELEELAPDYIEP